MANVIVLLTIVRNISAQINVKQFVKENYYEGVQNNINNSDVTIPRNTRWVPGGVHKPEQLIENK